MIVQVAMVDDEKAARDYIDSMRIWHMGEYALAFCAGSAEELMAYLKGTAVDILLMDVSMPETDGVSLSAKLKELYPQIDVVAISNYDDYDYVRQILKNGAKDYLLKHRLTEESLLAVLDRLAEMRRNPDEGEIGRLSQQLERFLQGDAAWPFARDGAIAVPCFGVMPALGEMPQEQRKRACRSVEHILTENHEPDMRRSAAAYGGTKFLLLLRFYDVLSRAAMEKRAAYICIHAQDAVRSLFQDNLTMSVGPILADQTTLPDYILERIRRDEEPAAARKKQLTLDQRTQIMNLLIQDQPDQLHGALKTVLDGAREEQFASRYLTIRALTDILRETAAEWRLDIQLPPEGSGLPAWIQAQSPDGLEKTILRLFDEALEKHREESLAGYSEPIREALSILKREYAQGLTLAGVAGRVGVSEAYLSRLFHKELHCSFSGYLTGLRMEQAKELMLQGIPIKTVSMETGYVQYTHFLRVFKQRVGMTPGQYANQNKIR